MTQTIAAIPTTYRGHAFRSRLEAKWAALFDLIGWKWTYEPFDTGGWIPDFLISGDTPFLVEVGPCVTAAEYIAKGSKARAAYPPVETLYGEPGDGVWLSVPERWTLVVGADATYAEPRWLGTAAGAWATSNYGHADGHDSFSFWHWCKPCNAIRVESQAWDTTYAPCGHYISPDDDSYWIRPDLTELWGEAGAATQWQPS